MCDIDVHSDISPEDEILLTPAAEQAGSPDDDQQPQKAVGKRQEKEEVQLPIEQPEPKQQVERLSQLGARPSTAFGKHAGLATPAVRGLLKELDIDILKVTGTGKDGRVLKEDVHRHAASRFPSRSPSESFAASEQSEERLKFSPIQAQMFKTMTRSLSIPHFLYADEIDITALSALRQRLNTGSSRDFASQPKLSYLPFIIKALSLALSDFPLLNARIDTSSPDNIPPSLIMRKHHNIGIAMDTPQGLLVPSIKSVQSHSITSLASEISRLQSLARSGSLSAKDLAGGTITVSNIGSIGGTYVSPIIASQNEIAILGIGKVRTVPRFGGEDGQIVRREVCHFSWSADHRVVDGATMARMGERVRALVEEPGKMIVGMR